MAVPGYIIQPGQVGGFGPILAPGAAGGGGLPPVDQFAAQFGQGQRLTPAQRAVLAMQQFQAPAGELGPGPASTTRSAAAQRLAQAARGTRGMGAAAMPSAAGQNAAASGISQKAARAAISGLGGGGAAGGGGAGAAGTAAGVVRPAFNLSPVTAAGAGGAAAGGAGAASKAGLLSQLGGKAALGRAAGSAGLGWFGGQLAAEGLTNISGGEKDGRLDDIGRGIIQGGGTGAGVGAGIGALGGPFAGITVPGGALAGGLIGGIGGGIYGALTGGDSKETEQGKAVASETEKFNETFEQYNVSPELRERFLMQFALTTDGLEKGQVNEVAQQMRALLPSLIIEDQARVEDERGRAAMFAAAQAWMAPMMQDAFSRSNEFAGNLSETMLSNAEGIRDPNQRAMAQQEAHRIPLDNATTQAYAMQQMMSLPGLYGYQTQLDGQGVPATDFTSIMGAQPIPGSPQMGGGVGAMPIPQGQQQVPPGYTPSPWGEQPSFLSSFAQ